PATWPPTTPRRCAPTPSGMLRSSPASRPAGGAPQPICRAPSCSWPRRPLPMSAGPCCRSTGAGWPADPRSTRSHRTRAAGPESAPKEFTVQQRYATHPSQVPGMSTAALRAAYLVPDLFAPSEIRTVLTHHDRVVLGGAVPAGTELPLPGYPEIRSDYFLEHREVGIVNVGGPGTVTADGERY